MIPQEPLTEPLAQDTPAVIYIGGTMRSGTTLLAELLAEHPGVVTVGESSGTWEALHRGSDLCGCGRPAAECPFWTLVLQCLREQLPDFSTKEAADLVARVGRTRRWFFLPPRRKLSGLLGPDGRQYVQLHAALLRAVAVVSGAATVVDSSKMPPTLRAYQWVPGLSVSVAHIVRDPRAVANSETQSLTHGGRPHHNDPPGKTATKSAAMWVTINFAIRLARRKADAYTLVRYEDLCRDTDAVLGQVLDNCGVRDIPAGSSPMRSHILVGNPSRFGKVQKPLRVDERWRRELDPALARRLHGVTRPVERFLASHQ